MSHRNTRVPDTRGDLLGALINLALPQTIGVTSGLFTLSSVGSWYLTLVKPSFSPPSYIFGPVWTTLYFLMGLSAYLVWINRKIMDIVWPKTIYLTQLLLNFLWSFMFFGLKNPFLAFLDILILETTIVLMILSFAKVSKPAALLQIPYLLWVSFAALLNFYIWKLN